MARRKDTQGSLERDDPLWFKDAIIYEIHVRAFHDTNGDGIGDFRGLTRKLDYLQDLGVTALWLLPFYPSPLRDDGYDIADYEKVHPSYGELRDFKEFLREAHKRGLRVITELVINHTSDQHPWFQRSRRAKPGSVWRDFYVWSDTPERYRDARIIFQDFESSNWSWDPVAGSYYWHRFYSHQPDLNFENPRVLKALKGALDFWMDLGVDGMRLDAIPYLFEREGTNCENLPETHELLKELRSHLDSKYRHRLFLAEANQWPEDAAAYFGDGDECHMNFHFPLMPRLFMGVRMEDRFPIIDILEQTPEIPENCQWAIFLRNHDELTLEMVTDEERDYMYRVYAHDRQARINLGIRRRLAPLLENNRRKIELMNGLLLSLPGTPVLYYGDEIGMGDNFYLGDRNGVRTPMQWSGDRNAGFSRANPQRLFLPVIIDPEYHFESVNVETQQGNPSSLLWWMKRILALRAHYKAFSRGRIDFLYPANRKVLAYTRSHGDETLLVVANLSRFAQAVELDLREFEGSHPLELFGHTEFPRIGELPYLLTLGPHAFYWFDLEHEARRDRDRHLAAPGRPARVAGAADLPVIEVDRGWEEVLTGGAEEALEVALPAYLAGCRWYQGKARRVRGASVVEHMALPGQRDDLHLAVVAVEFAEGVSELYLVPLAFEGGERAANRVRHERATVIAWVRSRYGSLEGALFDGLADPEASRTLLDHIVKRRRTRANGAEVAGSPLPALRPLMREAGQLEARPAGAEQSNTSISFGGRFMMKVYRRLDEGISLDLELGRKLGEVGFKHTPAVLGSIELRRGSGEPITLALLQEFVPNEGDAWDLTSDAVVEFYERAAAHGAPPPLLDVSVPGLLRLAREEPDATVRETMGAYIDHVWLIGRRTGELHLALALADGADFAPEPFSTLYQRSLYQSMRNLVGRSYQLLESRRSEAPAELREAVEHVLASREEVLRRLRAVVGGKKMSAHRIRIHGDYHLGQVLYTGRDFSITDFEGEPIRSLGERRLKRSPLRDVAGMLRSFHYAAHVALLDDMAGTVRESDVRRLEPWARFWYGWASGTFLRGYLEVAERPDLLPDDPEELETLLSAFILEKAVYELSYELNNRPDWMGVPLAGIRELLGS